MASPNSFREMKEDHLKCRVLTHAWDPVYTEPDQVYERRKCNALHVVCLRKQCQATKTVLFFTDGSRKSLPIAYDKDYVIANVKPWGGKGAVKRNAQDELVARTARKSMRSINKKNRSA